MEEPHQRHGLVQESQERLWSPSRGLSRAPLGHVATRVRDSRYGLPMTELPIFDARGGSLVSFVRPDRTSLVQHDEPALFDCSLVVVEFGERVLFGFNVSRQQWELPGGTVEVGESARDAALRELYEETSIRGSEITLVAHAEFTFAGEVKNFRAAVFAVTLTSAPKPVVSEELNSFVWWDPTGELIVGLSPLDAEVARRCFFHE